MWGFLLARYRCLAVAKELLEPSVQPWLCPGLGARHSLPVCRAVCAVGEPVHQAGVGLLQPCTVALPVCLWLIALPLFVSPLDLLSNVPPCATRRGHSWGPLLLTSFLPAHPGLSSHLPPLPVSTVSSSAEPSRSRVLLQQMHVTQGCPSPGCVTLTGSHPGPPCLHCPCSFSRWPCTACLQPGTCMRGPGGSQLLRVPRLLLAVPGCPEQDEFPLSLQE